MVINISIFIIGVKIRAMIPTFSKLNMNINMNFEYLLEIIWFSSIPVFVSEGFSSGHPDKSVNDLVNCISPASSMEGPSDSDLLALLALVRAAAPEVLVPHPEARDVLLRKVNIVCDHLN